MRLIMLTEVIYNRQILPLYYKLGIRWEPRPLVKPGQFVMLRFPNHIEPLLRRPFGVYRIIDGGIEILYKMVGKGTRLMTGLRPADEVDIFGPLGNGFPTPPAPPLLKGGIGGVVAKGGQRGLNIIMVAGGVGIAPFYLLSERLKVKGFGQRLLFGGRCEDDLPGLADFRKLGIDMDIATDDGSMGKKGFVTSHLNKGILEKAAIYACGPKGMLKEIARIAEDSDAPCYVSLDNVMACGIGACLGCAVKVRSQNKSELPTSHHSPLYRMVCKDGPVFDAREIEWEKV